MSRTSGSSRASLIALASSHDTKIDRADKKILRSLMEDGRLTNKILADKCCLSEPPMLRRVRWLKKHGYIRGYHADVDAELVGFPFEAHVLVGLSRNSENEIRAFRRLVEAIGNVRTCHMTAGETDFILRVVAESADKMDAAITLVRSFEAVGTCTTLWSVKQTKNAPGVPLEA